MDALYEPADGWFRPENDELVSRLRQLKWPEVPPDVRRRCWEDFSRRMSGSRGERGERARGRASARNVGERYEYTRRSGETDRPPVVTQRFAAAESAARSWSRRPRMRPSLVVA